MNKPRMTEKKARLLAALREDPGATVRELMERTGILSSNTIQYHIERWVAEGVINRPIRSQGGNRYPRRNYYSNSKLNKKRSEFARRGRIDNRQCGLMLTPKHSLTLEQRIEEVVKKAKQRSAMGPQLDVLRDLSHLVISRHAIKVG